MSCDNSITPSRDSYPVDSVHLLHFELKLFPKADNLQMIMTTLKMRSLYKASF